MTEVSLVQANELARRLAQAKQMRAEGADEAAIAEVEPTKEECRTVLLALRTNRTKVPATTTKKRATKNMSLKELLAEDI